MLTTEVSKTGSDFIKLLIDREHKLHKNNWKQKELRYIGLCEKRICDRKEEEAVIVAKNEREMTRSVGVLVSKLLGVGSQPVDCWLQNILTLPLSLS